MLESLATSFGVSVPYLCAVIGNIGVELTVALGSAANNGGRFPARYTRWPYLAGRAVFALVFAGSLPMMLGANTKSAAFYLGASAPLVYDKLARGLDPKSGP